MGPFGAGRRASWEAERRARHAAAAVRRAVTKSLYAWPDSSRGCDVGAAIVVAMDVVAIVLGIVMFAILLLIIEGIDRV